ncbi:sensor histidine kinase [Streptomyces scopuliridis]|uniref:Sensor histidine kinase n=1 Tax=Streptomyces scopuliridis TaxID=452529 RepID=A0ACD4ZUY6_9ACTN|nr:sensor histidine kinase [Streptomyces scopuliridis]WSC02270.1 sensor histidine kinase [Streptomyces scopuliridis]WSC04193.1 sensor histidine kinase [Streptomyces scopuliridis]
MRLRWPRRVAAQVLVVQLVITTGVMVLATGLFLAPLGSELDDAATLRALAIAQTTAADPDIAQGLISTSPSPAGPVQTEAERVRRATRALYVVVMDTHGVRWSHTTSGEIGRHVSTDPSAALSGREIRQIDNGTLGRSARAKVPLYDSDGRIIGAVSVGIAYDSVRQRLIDTIPGLLLCAGAALGAGALAAVAVSRRLRRITHGVAFADISALLDEREAMLHGVREGVVAFDRDGRIRLANDEAVRLLGLDADATGRALDEVLAPGRTTDVLAGRVDGTDLLAVSGSRVLVANRMPTRDGGAVVTLRDRTELELLGRELDSTQGLLDALRAQDHEHANRLHTVLGLLELGRHERAVEFVAGVASAHRASAEQIAERVRDPLVSALLVGKTAIAAERGVSLRISPATLLPHRVVDPRDLVTVLGNLIDNALDAAAERRLTEPPAEALGGPAAKPSAEPFVEVELRAEKTTAVIRVSDTGPGVPPEMRERVFAEGWSTKRPAPPPPSADPSDPAPVAFRRRRGIGLALVRRLSERYGGMARVTARAGGGAVFTVVLPEALAPDDLAGDGTPARQLTSAGESR